MGLVETNKTPLVSVVIPCYNQGEFLADAIDSVLAQTYAPVEVIVINDGSTDDTADVASRYGNRIQYLYQVNEGLSAARNTGISHAQGEFLHFLDADDFLPPDMLLKQIAAALHTPCADVLHSGWQEVDVQRIPGRRYVPASYAEDTFHALLANNLGPPCCVTVRRTAFTNSEQFDPALTSCEDWDMWLRLAAAGAVFVAVPDACAFYRRHARSMSSNYEHMWRMTCVIQEKARQCHPACISCAKARRIAYRSHRNTYFTSLLYHGILVHLCRREFHAGIRLLGRGSIAHPAFMAFLLKKSVLRTRKRMGIGADAFQRESRIGARSE